ncbi:MAG: hypothetical protein Q7S88_03545 [Candidatus Daviesbacteria bacterium]|nr:hypothetical protein [Candidatus Daviesbacteria bacterium]
MSIENMIDQSENNPNSPDATTAADNPPRQRFDPRGAQQQERLMRIKPEYLDALAKLNREQVKFQALEGNPQIRKAYEEDQPDEEGRHRVQERYNQIWNEQAIENAYNTLTQAVFEVAPPDDKTLERIARKEIEAIQVITEVGAPREYFWPVDDRLKVAKMHDYLNQIESLFTAEGTQTQRKLFGELVAVIDQLKKTKPDLGSAMENDFLQRVYFQQSFLALWNATDANSGAGSWNALYGHLIDTLFRDGGAYAEKVAENSNIPVLKMYRWHSDNQNAMRLLNPVFNEGDLKEEARVESRKYFLRQHEKLAAEASKSNDAQKAGKYQQEIDLLRAKLQISEAVIGAKAKKIQLVREGKNVDQAEADIEKTEAELKHFTEEVQNNSLFLEMAEANVESARLQGERWWLVTLKRHIQDPLITPEGKIVNSKEEFIEAAAHGKKLEFLGTARAGNFPIRRAISPNKWLWTQIDTAKGYMLHMDMVEGIDFNTRDMFTLLVDDYEKYLRSELRGVNFGSKDELSEDDVKALEAEVAMVMKDIFDVKSEEKDGKLKRVRDETNAYDLSKMVWKLSDFDELEQELLEKGFAEDSPEMVGLLERKIRLKSYCDSPKYETVFKGEVLVSYNVPNVRAPGALTSRHLVSPDAARTKITEKPGSLMFDPTSHHAVVEACTAFIFTADGQIDRQVQFMKNYAHHMLRAKEKTANPRSVDFLMAHVGAELKMSPENMDKVYKELEKTEYTPILDFLSYVPLDNFIKTFLVDLLMGILKAVVSTKSGH